MQHVFVGPMGYQAEGPAWRAEADRARDARAWARASPAQAWHANVRKLQPRLALAQLVAWLLPHDMFNHRRTAVYRAGGLRIGSGTQILGQLTLLGWDNMLEHLECGSDVFIETPCTISLGADVRIGDNVNVGPDAMILTGSHQIGGPERRCGAYTFAPVEIGAGAWIGARAVILPGVTIGPGCVVSAGSLVSRSMPANALVAGNPARVVGWLDQSGRPAVGNAPPVAA